MIKFLKSVVPFLVVVMILVSCSSEMPISDENQITKMPSDFKIAESYVSDLMAQIEGSTRANPRKLTSVDLIKGDSYRGAEADTLLYLLNYANESGYALIDAHALNGGVYVISPTGNLNLDDLDNDPLMSEYVANIKYYALSSLTQTRGDEVGPIIGWTNKFYTITEKVDPKLSSWVSGWKEDNVAGVLPYGKPGPITSAANALVKVWAYYRYPDRYITYNFYWSEALDNFNSFEKQRIQCVMNYPSILEGKIITDDVFKSSDDSGDYGRNIPYTCLIDAFENAGYGSPQMSKRSDLDFFNTDSGVAKIKSIIRGSSNTNLKGAPIICFAKPNVSLIPNPNKFTQYWIIDGFVDRTSQPMVNMNPTGNPMPCPTLYHCVWGKGSYFDGYYAYTLSGEFDNVEHTNLTSGTTTHENQPLFPKPAIIGGFNREVP